MLRQFVCLDALTEVLTFLEPVEIYYLRCTSLRFYRASHLAVISALKTCKKYSDINSVFEQLTKKLTKYGNTRQHIIPYLALRNARLRFSKIGTDKLSVALVRIFMPNGPRVNIISKGMYTYFRMTYDEYHLAKKDGHGNIDMTFRLWALIFVITRDNAFILCSDGKYCHATYDDSTGIIAAHGFKRNIKANREGVIVIGVHLYDHASYKMLVDDNLCLHDQDGLFCVSEYTVIDEITIDKNNKN